MNIKAIVLNSVFSISLVASFCIFGQDKDNKGLDDLKGINILEGMNDEVKKAPVKTEVPPNDDVDTGKSVMKIDVPSEEDQKKAIEEIKGTYAEKYKSSDPKVRRELANELCAEALKKKNPPEARYAFFNEAILNLAYAGDYKRMMQVVGEMGGVFKINRVEFAMKELAGCEKSLKTLGDQAILAEAYIKCYSWAVDDELYDDAARILNSASIYAKKANSGDLISEIKDLNKELFLLKKEYALAAGSIEKLKAEPDDPAANFAAGKFYCFTRDNWEKGLPMLAKGQDEKMRQLASGDLEDPVDVAEMTQLADSWWSLSEDKDYRLLQNDLRERACYWYQKTLPSLTDLEKTKIEKKIDLFNSALGLKRSSANLPKGAVLAFSFDKNTINKKSTMSTLSDLSGQRNDGILHAIKFVKGTAGDAAEFDGKESYIEVRDSKTLNLEGNLTISMWIEPVDFGSRRNPFNKCYGGEGTMTIEEEGTINFFYGSTGKDIRGGYSSANSSKVLIPGKWNHVAVVRDMKTAKTTWYFNGELSSELPLDFTNIKASRANILIGKGYVGFYSGMLDELAVFNRALPEREIKELFSMGKRGQSF